MDEILFSMVVFMMGLVCVAMARIVIDLFKELKEK